MHYNVCALCSHIISSFESHTKSLPADGICTKLKAICHPPCLRGRQKISKEQMAWIKWACKSKIFSQGSGGRGRLLFERLAFIVQTTDIPVSITGVNFLSPMIVCLGLQSYTGIVSVLRSCADPHCCKRAIKCICASELGTEPAQAAVLLCPSGTGQALVALGWCRTLCRAFQRCARGVTGWQWLMVIALYPKPCSRPRWPWFGLLLCTFICTCKPAPGLH